MEGVRGAMDEAQVVYGPLVEPQGGQLVYQVTLASGHVVTRPTGFGDQLEERVAAIPVMVPVPLDDAPQQATTN